MNLKGSMNRAVAVLALVFGAAYASTTVTVEPWTLYAGSSIVRPRVAYPNDITCIDAAKRLPPGTYTCRGATKIVNAEGVIVAPPSMWPVPQPGVSDVRLYQGTVPALPSDWEQEGAFRLICNWSRMSYDDPIVYPGQPGAAHHHTFFGNTAIDAYTTSENIRSRGNATCRGGTINLSGYWVPSMIDTATGLPIAPKTLLIYYKTGLWPYFNDGSVIQPIPKGLKMVVGKASNATPENMPGVWYCGDANGNGRAGTVGPSIPTSCLAGDDLRMSLDFQQCWDGKNLDSPDHRSHMAAPVQFWTGDPQRQWRCPSTHPVVLPKIGFVVQYHLPTNLDTSKWRLSSDVYTGPGGYSMHADWMNGWDPAISALWGQKCMVERRNCGSANLGDGRETSEFQGN
jgi:hypothetical protein